MVDGAESVGDPVLAPMADQHQPAPAEGSVAVGAGHHRLGPGRLGRNARLPVRALDRPGNDVLQPAEDRPPLAFPLGQSEAVA